MEASARAERIRGSRELKNMVGVAVDAARRAGMIQEPGFSFSVGVSLRKTTFLPPVVVLLQQNICQ